MESIRLMQEPTTVGGANDTSGGAASENHEEKTEYVKRRAYESLLDESKAFKQKFRDTESELSELKAKLQADNEAKMLEEKKYVEVIDSLKTEKQKLEEMNLRHEQDKLDFRRTSAILGQLNKKGVNLESKYYDFLPLDQVGFDQDGNIDTTSLANATDAFVKEHPRLTTPMSKLFPNPSTDSNVGPKMSIAEWKRLDPKERKKALADKRVKMK